MSSNCSAKNDFHQASHTRARLPGAISFSYPRPPKGRADVFFRRHSPVHQLVRPQATPGHSSPCMPFHPTLSLANVPSV